MGWFGGSVQGPSGPLALSADSSISGERILTGGTDIELVDSGPDAALTINYTGTGITTFSGLSDTPADYSGAALDILRVNAGATAVEFVSEGSDFLAQYALLAGRAGGQVQVGGTGAGESYTIRATSNATPGPVICEVEPGVEAWRTLATGEPVFGRTTLTAATYVAEFEKLQNAGTALTIRNETDGTAATAEIALVCSTGPALAATIAQTAASFSPVVGMEAASLNILAHTNSDAVVLLTRDDKPIKFNTDGNTDTTNSTRAQIDKSSGLSLKIGIKSLSATEIGVQVTNAALTVGSLGSVVLPVKTTALAPDDAAGGNLDGAVVVNTNEDSLYYRSGGTWKKVDRQLEEFTANDAIYPSAAPAGFASRNEHGVIAYDDGVEVADEKSVLEGMLSNDYSGGDIMVDIDWVAELAVAGDVVWGVEIERNNAGGTDIDSDSFDTQKLSSADTTNAASGIPTRTTITLTNAEADAIAAGDRFRLRLQAKTSNGGYTMLDDAQVIGVSLRQ